MMKLLLPLLLFVFFCCSRKVTADNCTELNIQAVDALNEYTRSGNDSSQLLISLGFFNKAIECDSSNVINYQGKLSVMNLLGRNEESLKIINKLISLNDVRFASLFTTKALIFERIGVKDSSEVYFQKAFFDYDQQLALKPADSLKVMCEKLYLIAITENKDVAIEKLKTLEDKYPDDPTIRVYEEILMRFDRSILR